MLGQHTDILLGADGLIEEQRRIGQIEKAENVRRFESVCRHKNGCSIDAVVTV